MQLRLVVLVMGVVMVWGVQGVIGGDLTQEMTRLGATTALNYLSQAGLLRNLSQEFLTLFVPTNQAWASVPQNIRDIYEKDPAVLRSLLQYHAVSGIFRSLDAFNNLKLNATTGQNIRVNVYQPMGLSKPVVTVDGARVLQADIRASNGFLHMIEHVMPLPGKDAVDFVRESQDLSILYKALQASDLMGDLRADGLTLFAPTDQAFRDVITQVGQATFDRLLQDKPLLQDLIRYHVVPSVIFSAGAEPGVYHALDLKPFNISITQDQRYFINDAQVVLGDVAVDNGVVHVINKVIFPPMQPRPMVG